MSSVVTRVRNLCDKFCEFLFTNWLHPTYASQTNAICAQNSPKISQTVRSLVVTKSEKEKNQSVRPTGNENENGEEETRKKKKGRKGA